MRVIYSLTNQYLFVLNIIEYLLITNENGKERMRSINLFTLKMRSVDENEILVSLTKLGMWKWIDICIFNEN